MSDEKMGLMSRLFGRGKDEGRKTSKPGQEPGQAPGQKPQAKGGIAPDERSPAVAKGGAPDLGRGQERTVHPVTAEEDTEAGAGSFLHQTPEDEGGIAGKDEASGEGNAADEEPRSPAPEEPAARAASPATPSAPEPKGAPPRPAGELAAKPAAEPKKRGFFGRLSQGLSRTSQRLSGGVADIFTKRKLDEETIEEFEDLLISADLGLPATERVVGRLRKERIGQDVSEGEVRQVLASVVAETLTPLEQDLAVDPSRAPHVVLVVGVNGAGKTTTIGKLAAKWTGEGHKVLLAAGDTFRAAAVEQLKIWGERVGVPVLSKPQGADAAGLAYEAIETAKAEGLDVVLIDTAGRLQNRAELMDELSKIVRVVKKLAPEAPHDTLLVLDATVGQNAVRQAEAFTETAGVTGLVMTKLDGTARGGILVALGERFALPIHYIGVGESIDDLRRFEAQAFAEAMTTDIEDIN